jgi:phosphoserine aminotransferase
MAPMNLLRGSGRAAEYVVTGSWGAKAFEEARRIGDARIVWDGGEDGYVRVPSADELAEVSAFGDAAYLHVTTNETIQGVEWPTDPAVEAETTPVADMSSDFLSRPIDVERYGVAYAGAQKNAGPAGVTIVLVRDDLLGGAPADVPHMLDYCTYAESGSLYNTPPVFAVYVVMLVTRWLRDEIGGLEKMAEINAEKASLLYEAIDASNGFYRGHAHPGSRSRMNVTWRLANDDLEREFLTQAAERGLMELRGHRSVGGIRASIYNAMPLEGVEALRELMDDFRARG